MNLFFIVKEFHDGSWGWGRGEVLLQEDGYYKCQVLPVPGKQKITNCIFQLLIDAAVENIYQG